MGIKYICNTDSCNVSKNDNTYTFFYPCVSEEICSPYKVLLTPGIYTIECYGAKGGDTTSNLGGLGGISKGMIVIHEQKSIFVSIGAPGSIYGLSKVYGGGGSGSSRKITTQAGGGSGGGSAGHDSAPRTFGCAYPWQNRIRF